MDPWLNIALPKTFHFSGDEVDYASKHLDTPSMSTIQARAISYRQKLDFINLRHLQGTAAFSSDENMCLLQNRSEIAL